MPSSKKQVDNVLKMQEKIKEGQLIINSLRDDLKMERDRAERISDQIDSYNAEIREARKTCESRVNTEGKTLSATIRDIISRQERETEKLYERIEAVKQENDRLWYMMGVVMKDPNTLRTQQKIGMRPGYAQKRYGEAFVPHFNDTFNDRPNNNY